MRFQLAIFILLLSCVPVSEDKLEGGACDEGQAFNAKLRRCETDKNLDLTPIGTLKTVTIQEDTVSGIVLTYSDPDDDFALSCNVGEETPGITLGACTCVGGFCSFSITPSSDFFGLAQFAYTLTDDDGTGSKALVRVTVVGIDDVPTITAITPSTAVTFDEDTSTIFTVTYADGDGDVATNCETNNVSTNASISSPCSCFGSSCTFTLLGAADATGTGDLDVRVFANTEWSATTGITYTISAVNDAPVVSNSLSTSTLLEDFATEKIEFQFSDIDSTSGFTCSLTNLTGMSTASACSCPSTTCSADFTSAVGDSNSSVPSTFSFEYTISDGGLSGTSTTMYISVTPVNDEPTFVSFGTSPFGATSTAVSCQENNTDGNCTGLAFSSFDEGGSTDEDSQAVLLKVESLSPTVIKNSTESIVVKSSGTTLTPDSDGFVTIGSTSTSDSNISGITIDLIPETGISSTADIQFTLKDVEGTDISTTSTTAKVFYSGINSDPAIFQMLSSCNFSEITSTCSNTSYKCAQPGSPVDNLIIPNDINLIYLDVRNYKCYRSTSTASATGWTEIKTSCDITHDGGDGGCTGGSCMGSGTPVGTTTASNAGTTFFDYTNEKCYYSTVASSNSSWVEISATSTDSTTTISDVLMNVGGVAYLKGLRFDEGGGDLSENTSTLTLSVESATTGFLVKNNLELWNTSTFFPPTPVSGSNKVTYLLDGPTEDAGSLEFLMKFFPNNNLVGNVSISFSLSDGTSATSKSFNLGILPISVGHQGWSQIMSQGAKVDKDGVTQTDTLDSVNVAGAYTKISWNAFTLSGGTDSSSPSIVSGITDYSGAKISGHNVYRKKALEEFDYSRPLNGSTPIPSGTLSYVDSINTIQTNPIHGAPAEKTVYYYRVVAIDDKNSLPIFPSSPKLSLRPFKLDEVRVVIPPDNMSFVHRWMVNKEVCASMGKNSDPSNHYRCSYTGPGAKLGSDCPVSGQDANSNCPARGCIVSGTPPTASIAANFEIWQESVTQQCYFSKTGPASFTKFSTDCPISSSVVETGCASQGKSCMGANNPLPSNLALTPTRKGSYFYDTSADKCYRSTRPTGASGAWTTSDWEIINSGGGFNNYYYDIGQDLLVDRFEAGCPYSIDPACPSGICIGMGTPQNEPASGSLFYQRDAGTCWYVNGTTPVEASNSAAETNYATFASKVNAAHLPPLTSISQKQGMQLCEARTTAQLNLGGSFTSTLSYRLPRRKEQIAYSAWQSGTGYSDTEVNAFEAGITLSKTNPKCNTNSANGLESSFSNTDIPSALDFFTLPGTLVNGSETGIRSLMTGSEQTLKCSSLYGIQDTIGNVKEWTSDRIYCPTDSYCVGVSGRETGEICLMSKYIDNTAGTASCRSTSENICVGSGAPLLSGISHEGLFYWDVDSNSCYVSYDNSGVLTWKQMSTLTGAKFCPATPASIASTCAGSSGFYSCISTDSATQFSPSGIDNLFLSLDVPAVNSSCHTATTATSWNTAPATNLSVTLTIPDKLDIANEDMTMPSGTSTEYFLNSYAFDGMRGPCNDTNPVNGFCDSALTSWTFSDESFSAGRFLFPLGLPIITSFTSNFPNSNANSSLLEIGPVTGITSNKLHSDTISVNTSTLTGTNSNNGCGSMNTGGSYLSGNGAGRYNVEFLPCNDANGVNLKAIDVGFRCVSPIPHSIYLE